jgi:diguanylate cyclase
VILPETGADDALVVARRIQEQIKNRPFYPLDENAVHITVSVGVTDYAPGEDMLGLVKRADQALFDSKRSGRDKITLTPAARFPLSQ